MQDRETGSLWSHVTGECIYGELEGWKLEMIPSVQTTWAKWVNAHPNTAVLKKKEKVLESRYAEYTKSPEKLGIFRTNAQLREFPGKSMIHGMTVEDEKGSVSAVAISDDLLAARSFVEVNLAGRFFVAFRSKDGGVRAWEAMLNEKPLFFKRDPEGRIRDEETTSLWNLEAGESTEGKLAGARLKEIVVRPAFWFAWISFYPNSAIQKAHHE